MTELSLKQDQPPEEPSYLSTYPASVSGAYS
jgi:hypothetical protein